MTRLLSFYTVVSRGRELERAPCLALVRDFYYEIIHSLL